MGKTLPLGAKIGFDPMIMPYRQWKTLQKDLDKYGHALVPVTSNLIDMIWHDQPSPPSNLVVPLELNFTGTYQMMKQKTACLSSMCEHNVKV